MYCFKTSSAHANVSRNYPDPSVPGVNEFGGGLLGYMAYLSGASGILSTGGYATDMSIAIADDLGCAAGISTRYFMMSGGRVRIIRGDGTNFYTFDYVKDLGSIWVDGAVMTPDDAIAAYPSWLVPVRPATGSEFGVLLSNSLLPATSTTIKYTLADAIYGSVFAPGGTIFMTVLESRPNGIQLQIPITFYRNLPSQQLMGTSTDIYLTMASRGTSQIRTYINNSGFWDNDGRWVIGTNWTATWNYSQSNGYVESTGVAAIGALYTTLPQINVGSGNYYCGDMASTPSWGYTFRLLAVPGGGLRCRIGMRKVSDGTWVYGSWYDTTGRKYETFARTVGGFDRMSIQTEGSGFRITSVQALAPY